MSVVFGVCESDWTRATSVPTCARVPRRVEKSQSFGSSQVDMYENGILYYAYSTRFLPTCLIHTVYDVDYLAT